MTTDPDDLVELDWTELCKDVEPLPPIKYGRNIRVKITPSGGIFPTHPQAPLGKHGEVRTVQINTIPSHVSEGEAIRLYASTIDLSDSPMWEFETLKPGKILR